MWSKLREGKVERKFRSWSLYITRQSMSSLVGACYGIPLCGLSGGIPYATELIGRRARLMRDIKSHSAMSPPPSLLTSIWGG